MKTLRRMACGLSLAVGWTVIFTAPISAEVVVNNLFSPFTTIRVAPAYRVYTPSPARWIHDPTHHQRCYRRWLPYFGEWHWHCVRMHGVD